MTRASQARGFTLVELLTVVSITALGFVALLNLQIGTIQGTGTARDMQQAMTLAESISQTMRIEAMQWTASSLPQGNPTFPFLSRLPANSAEGQTSGWFAAYTAPNETSSDLQLTPVGGSPTYDVGASGEYLGPNGETFDERYCAHVRLTWLIPDVLVRADVRVFWARHRADFTAYEDCAITSGTGPDPQLMARTDQIQMVTIPVTIMRNVFVRQIGAGAVPST